ncbi:hypothetical protein [Pontibacter sp. G13]|uniref:hypothetical protein n=1 Tax=Pontibacter sp. G13 TaxID=3074898 RepID=UPI00288904C4|nr:hypothetical protein [Pontibacter sp. G13]WNJ15926.1 hypothetical protein RJD25_13765 [Pontibacter sp. G13]
MKNVIGIRREDLNKKGEKRVALVPEAVAHFCSKDFRFLVQPGIHPETQENKRAFSDSQYMSENVSIQENLDEADLIFGLKEIQIDAIIPEKAYLFFSHTHKGQIKNRPMLKKLVDQKATLIDYELITDDSNRRLITAFTYYAGYAGMTDSLWALGKKWHDEGILNPFSKIPQSIEKEDLDEIKSILSEVADDIRNYGTPESEPPVVVTILGNGKTSAGSQEMLDLLPFQEITLDQLPSIYETGNRRQVYKLVLTIPEMYRLIDPLSYPDLAGPDFSKMYLQHPERFESNLENVFPYSTIIMNCIIWSPSFPRLITRKDAAIWFEHSKTLQVIGDITCDPEGAIEFSKETWIDDPIFTYFPQDNSSKMGIHSDGISVMAVTNLPCEFSADASIQFCSDLGDVLEGLLSANFQSDLAINAGLPKAIERAVILWKGDFTPKFKYMESYLPK